MTDKQKTQLERFEGEVRWATIPPRPARGPHKDYTTDANRNDLNYSIQVECSAEKFKELKKAGIPRLTELKEDEATGKTYINLKVAKRKTRSGDEPMEFKDIKVYGEDGEPLTENVGNGSEAIVVAELVDVKRGKVLRLKSVRITKLIPFADKNDNDVNEMLGLNTIAKKKPDVVGEETENDYF